MMSVLDFPFYKIAKLYREKALSPIEVVKETLKRLKKLEPTLNAFIEIFEEEALNKARLLETKFVAEEHLSILAGIPFTVKDLFDTKDRVTTCGSRILKANVANQTADVVQLVLEQDSILIGKTNLLEFAYGVVHPDYGQTNNPWDPSRTAGGSSGGSAAAIAAGLGYFSFGTDTGGSIRIPASYCGIAGLKPTFGRLSDKGVFPLSWSLDHVGPMAKSAQELSILMDALLEQQSFTQWSDVKLDPVSELTQPIRVGFLPDEVLQVVDPEVACIYDQTRQQIQDLGWQVIPISIEDWEAAETLLMKILLPEATFIHRHWLERQSDYAPGTYSQLESGLKQGALDYIDGLKGQQKFKRMVEAVFHSCEVIVMPTVSFPAPSEDPLIGDDERNELIFTGPFNVSGHPAVTINAGFTKEGLPVGMQWVGPLYQDQILLKIAAYFEQKHPINRKLMLLD